MKEALTYEQAAVLNQAIRQAGIRHRALAASLLSRLGLHPGQEVLLLQLDEYGPRTPAQLSAGAGCEPPSVTLMVRKLETAGLVTREPSPDDRRSVTVSLTPRGRALVPELHAVWQELADTTVAGLHATPAPALIAALADLAAGLGARGK
jgi:DNA-binding MarR family transcriptional regulator